MRMLRRPLPLWVRLSAAFSLVMVAGLVLFSAIGIFVNQGNLVNKLLSQQLEEPGGLIESLQQHYRQFKNWENLQLVFDNLDAQIPAGPGQALTFVFADGGGNIIYDPQKTIETPKLTPQQREEAIAVRVDNRVRGYVLLMPARLQVPDDVRQFINGQMTNLLIRSALMVSVISILTGIFVSRWLTAPLKGLAETARAFGGRDFSRRARVKGSAEMAAVATAFNDMAEALENAEKLRRNLTADVAHELRTPLSVLRANLTAILDGVYPMNQDEIQRLMDQTELLSHLVNDLHLLAQADAHQLPVCRTDVNLNVLVEQTVQQFQPMAGNTLLKQDIPNLPVHAHVDANRIQQVINNLLQNALTYTPVGGQVTVRLDTQDTHARIVIQDTGSGIPPEHLTHIFERFYRADRSRSRATGGTGLGLAIAKAIVEAHSGTI